MKRRLLLSFGLAAALLTIALLGSGCGLNPQMTYQGRLTDDSGNPLNGIYTLTFEVEGAGPGKDTPVFIHEATAGNISCGSNQCTEIDHPLTNGDPNATLIVTQNWNPGGGVGGTYNDHSIGVWYDSSDSKWKIFNQDLAAMPVGAAFNVLVVKP